VGDELSALSELVRRGRRRSLLHLFIDQLALSVAIAFGGCILLLLLGTQILNWYWLVALFAVSLAVGLWRGQSRIPSAYQVARSIDHRLNLSDSLSTAFYFGEHPEGTRSPRDIVEKQRAAAEERARTVDLHVGIPFAAPRSFIACGVLAVAAFGIFGIRYGVTRSLDLRPSLVRIAFDGVLGQNSEIAAAKRKQLKQIADEEAKQLGMAVDPLQAQALDMDPASNNALDTVETPEVNNPDGGADPSKGKASPESPENAPQDPSAAGENSDQSSSGNDAADNNASDKNSPQSSGKPDQKNSNQSSSNSGENSSLTDKMRDALANLLSKLKMQQKTGEGKQSASNSQNGSQSGQKQSASKDQNGTPTPGKPQGDASASPDAQGEQAQNGEQSQSAQGKSNGKNSDRANSQDSKSGIGKEDGDKSAREAEQLAAMGKISEIIGKRAQNVKGEVMVEVASGKQQLRTQYSQRTATHVEAGSDINRDEIPLAYQQYVQQYFEEIRKLPAPKTGKGSPEAKPKTPGS
jgi:hypothetical protein